MNYSCSNDLNFANYKRKLDAVLKMCKKQEFIKTNNDKRINNNNSFA